MLVLRRGTPIASKQPTTTREMLSYGSLLSVHSFTPNLTTRSLLVIDEVSLRIPLFVSVFLTSA